MNKHKNIILIPGNHGFLGNALMIAENYMSFYEEFDIPFVFPGFSYMSMFEYTKGKSIFSYPEDIVIDEKQFDFTFPNNYSNIFLIFVSSDGLQGN